MSGNKDLWQRRTYGIGQMHKPRDPALIGSILIRPGAPDGHLNLLWEKFQKIVPYNLLGYFANISDNGYAIMVYHPFAKDAENKARVIGNIRQLAFGMGVRITDKSDSAQDTLAAGDDKLVELLAALKLDNN